MLIVCTVSDWQVLQLHVNILLEEGGHVPGVSKKYCRLI